MTTFFAGTLSLFSSLAHLDIFQYAVAGCAVFGVVSLVLQIVRG